MLISYNDLGRVVEKAIMLLGCSSNYYHFTFEIMSRFPFIDQEEKYHDWPILIDKCVMEIPSLRELLNCMNTYHHEIIIVEKYEKVRVNNMLYVSPTMWIPLNFLPGVERYPSDFIMTAYTVNNVRNTVLQKINTDNESDKKIYLSRRKCANVRLVNGEEVERIFAKSGFRIICPEELSFEEQVKLFGGADIIVGPAGAAFTNLIYCRPGTTLGIISARKYEQYVFSNLAHIISLNYILLDAEVVMEGRVSSLSMFQLDPDICNRFIEKWDKENIAKDIQ